MDMVEATKHLDIEFVQVGEQPESGHSFLSQGTGVTAVHGKQLSFVAVKDNSGKRFTIDSHKLYLDCCATYHSTFVGWMLDDMKTVSTLLQEKCNVGVSTSNEKGFYGLWNFWLNEQGIANLLSIPQLEKYGYTIDYNTKCDWVVTTPEVRFILFKKDTVICEGMPYLDVRDNMGHLF